MYDIFSSYNDHIIDQLDPLSCSVLLDLSCHRHDNHLDPVHVTTNIAFLWPCVIIRALKALENMELKRWSKQQRLSSVTNSQNLGRLYGQSYWNFRQCTRKLLLSNPRRNIQRQPLGKSSANPSSHLSVHRQCFLSPMWLVWLEKAL